MREARQTDRRDSAQREDTSRGPLYNSIQYHWELHCPNPAPARPAARPLFIIFPRDTARSYRYIGLCAGLDLREFDECQIHHGVTAGTEKKDVRMKSEE